MTEQDSFDERMDRQTFVNSLDRLLALAYTSPSEFSSIDELHIGYEARSLSTTFRKLALHLEMRMQHLLTDSQLSSSKLCESTPSPKGREERGLI